jgi:hypothetical protein
LVAGLAAAVLAFGFTVATVLGLGAVLIAVGAAVVVTGLATGFCFKSSTKLTIAS